jgi:uncharacterized protein (TIGR02147 family)
MINIFSTQSAAAYLKNWFGSSVRRTGKRQLAAKCLRCHPTHITQILSGKSRLSLEHAIELNSFFGHGSEESEYFLLLVQFENSGTSRLRQYFQSTISEIQKKQARISAHVRTEIHFDATASGNTYYSAWYYAAIHMATLIERLSRTEQLSSALGLPLDLVHTVVTDLEKLGIVSRNSNGSIKANIENLHLPSNNMSIIRHHVTWRTRAQRAIEESPTKGMHYSGVASMSVAASEDFRSRVLALLKSLAETSSASKSEQLFNFNLDFYGLT